MKRSLLCGQSGNHTRNHTWEIMEVNTALVWLLKSKILKQGCDIIKEALLPRLASGELEGVGCEIQAYSRWMRWGCPGTKRRKGDGGEWW